MRHNDETMIDFENDGTIIDPHKKATHDKERLYLITNPYQGSKRGLIKDIAHELDVNGVKYDSVLDLFNGSGIVSLFMKLNGKRVVSNDLLTSSYFNALVFVENNHVALGQDDIDFLCRNNNPGKTDFVTSRFGGKRFTMAEAAFLDNYRANIDTLTDRKFEKDLEACHQADGPNSGVVLRTKDIFRALCFIMVEHYIMSRCFLGGRLNNGQVLAKLDHRLKHDRNATLDHSEDSMTFQMQSPPQFFDGEENHHATNLDALVALQKLDSHIDLAYLDPPYGGQQSDYATMFAFNEEYVYRKPLDELSHLTTSKKFVDAKGYEGNFREILEHAKHISAWAISYNDSSWADVNKIKGIIGDYKKNVVPVNISHRYKYRAKEGRGGTEYLLIAR